MTSAFVCEGRYLTISVIDDLIIILFLYFIRKLSLDSRNDFCDFFFTSQKRKMTKSLYLIFWIMFRQNLKYLFISDLKKMTKYTLFIRLNTFPLTSYSIDVIKADFIVVGKSILVNLSGDSLT